MILVVLEIATEMKGVVEVEKLLVFLNLLFFDLMVEVGFEPVVNFLRQVEGFPEEADQDLVVLIMEFFCLEDLACLYNNNTPLILSASVI